MAGDNSYTTSLLLSVTLGVLFVAGLQFIGESLASSKIGTILGGFLASLVFIFALTAINNLEKSFINRSSAARFFPHALLAIIAAMATAATIHPVCVTTSAVFSLVHFFFLTRVSDRTYNPGK